MTVLVPHSVLAAGWIPFVVVTLLVLLFSFVYIRYYQHKYDKELCSTIASILGLALAMFTCALVPVDIFLVSYMKTSDGTYKDWAQDVETRNAIENGVLYAYYALYCVIILFLFLILPLSYFYYEEGDENTTNSARCCTAFKFTLIFVFMAIVLFLVGVLVPFKGSPPQNSTDTDWEQIKNLFEDLGNNHGENAFSFMISFLSFFGMFTIVIYTGIGMGVWPVHLIKGRRSVLREYREVTDQRAMTRSQIDAIRNTSANRQLSSSERRRLQVLEDEEELIGRRERHLEMAEGSCLRKCGILLRPFQIVFGVFFVLISLLIFISLLMSNIDKLMHSLGPQMGYILPEHELPNVLDIVLVFSQKVFPLDYILMFAVVFFLIFCSMGGVNAIGIWFLWIRMFRIRAHKTRPQGLLFLCFLLMYIVLALNILLYQMTPQYFTYGSQHYQMNVTVGNQTDLHQTITCSTSAPADACTMTRMATLLYRFFYKLWFFGAAYYWMSWAFLLVFVVSFLVAVIRKKRSYIEGEVDEEDIEDDEDDEMIRNI